MYEKTMKIILKCMEKNNENYMKMYGNYMKII